MILILTKKYYKKLKKFMLIITKVYLILLISVLDTNYYEIIEIGATKVKDDKVIETYKDF